LREHAEGKNLVMVLLDAAAVGHFHYAGYERETTPVIDELAASSIDFDVAYSHAASTGHSVYSMMTSTYPFLSEKQGLKGVRDAAFRITEQTHLMAELLQDRFDHRTGISANEWFSREFGFDRGFTDFYETWNPADVSDTTRRRGESTVEAFRKDLASWGDGPAFAYVHFLEPHSPYTPPDRFARMFDPVAADSVDAGSRAMMRWRDVAPSPRHQEMFEALYDGNLAYADSLVGEIIGALKQAGKWENTVFVLIADHGEAFWQHGVHGHGRRIYEEFVRIPMLVRLPGASDFVEPHVAQPVSLIDLLPTYLDLLSLPPSPDQRGDSLLPLIAGRTEPFEHRKVFLRNTHLDVPEWGVRAGRYKWIYKVYENRYELYDLVADPGERHDLVAAGAVPPEAEPLKAEVALWVATGTERVEPVDEIDPATMERLEAIGYF
jgi:arylsulfatase